MNPMSQSLAAPEILMPATCIWLLLTCPKALVPNA